MNSALWVSKTGLEAQDLRMTTISNNLANVSTVGFKKDRAMFQDLFYQVQRQPGTQADALNEIPAGLQLGTGVRVNGTQKQFTEGPSETTSNPLDIAITGQGFFQIDSPDGETLYTRNGQFQLNSDSVMVNSDGLPLSQNITVPANTTKVTIGKDGTVTAVVAGDNQPQELGQILTVNFVNPAGLEALGGNLYRATAASGEATEGVPGEDALGQLQQFTVEGSNVSVVDEMVDMIAVQRAYEMNAKVVSAADEMLRFVNQSM
ncbi:MAG: flagellar basal-body rod protein FlgG [Shewanella sp.]|jgi:flagellar basal-body rod protein FlgG|uniref:flagellar basal-body rod protein FlgG n=1 Tax=Shewanella TaxID=22 RepID=UPI001677C5CA|nr:MULTISPECIES: flagellar basal-body rod protein FlgG [Shewanella]MBO1272145.1 flagellar basal-body rod protein FlgG [Shewanella sp. 4t3-1-2LB]MCL2908003.1 flagellar basal-body rod protein FlgG [Shewanella fodinae]MDN5370614.1 flagellar basal-body rod protein FlgG [Shewanella sp.]GGZ12767.1 flagellar basal-body rod protein FlgG [Shewanella fodinae]